MKGNWIVNGINEEGVSTILFGITSGLLSLVGLIAIYMSINNQQNIQKAKEYLWELQSFTLNNRVQDENSAKKLEWIYHHYCELQKTSRSTKSVVALASFVLLFCGFFWTIYILYSINNLNHFLFVFLVCSLAALFSILLLILSFTRTDLMGNLPKPDKLFDIHSSEEGVDMSELIFSYISIDVAYSSKRALLVVTLNTPVPINTKNIKLKPGFVNRSESDIIIFPSKDFKFTRGRPVTSYNNIELPIDNEGNKKDFSLSLYLEDEKYKDSIKETIIISTYTVEVTDSKYGHSGPGGLQINKIIPTNIKNVRKDKLFMEKQKEAYDAVINQESQNTV